MKKKTDYSRFTSKELEKQIKTIRFVTGLLAGMLIVLLGITLYDSISQSKLNPLLVSPIALSAIIPINMKRIREIKRELERRQPNNDQ